MREASDGCPCVARHLNLRKHCNITCRCILNNLPNLLLCIETAVRGTVINARKKGSNNGLLPYRTFLSKLRIFLYLNPPALILSKMPVESIELVHCHKINIPLDESSIKEVAAHIKMHTPVRKSRLVLNRHALYIPAAISLGIRPYLIRKHL